MLVQIELPSMILIMEVDIGGAQILMRLRTALLWMKGLARVL